MTPPTLAGAGCLLRALTPADAPSLAAHADDQEVARRLFEGFPHPYTLADAEHWCGGGWRERGWVWGIEVDAAVVGCIGLDPDAGWLRCNAEAGWWLGRAHWGRGLMTEALRRVTAWAGAARPEWTRLYAPIFADNLASQAVARKAGWGLEARMRRSAVKDGQVIDRVQYAVYRDGERFVH